MSGAGSETAKDAISPEVARAWIERWDVQQQGYLPDREDRFTALIDAVEEAAGRPDPLVLDLGSGPGSLAVRLLRRIPAARVIALDADPLTLGLGRAAWHDLPGLNFIDADLRTPGWSADLDLERQPDAVVSTTALHWLSGPALEALYAELASVLRPGGLVLNGDHLRSLRPSRPCAGSAGALIEREEQRRFPADIPRPGPTGGPLRRRTPALAGLVAERAARLVESEHHGSPAGLLSVARGRAESRPDSPR